MTRRRTSPRTAAGTIQLRSGERKTTALPLPAVVELRLTDADGNSTIERVLIDAEGTFAWEQGKKT